MKLILTLRDTDIGLDTPVPDTYQERTAARAIVFDADNHVALLHASKKSYHKLPGGGVEKDEDVETALRRELIEEIGCEVSGIREFAVIEEFRDSTKLHQFSHCFIAHLEGEKGQSHLEPDEIDDGFETVWVSLSEAIDILEGEDDVPYYEGKFIRLRDLAFLKESQTILSQKT